MADAFVGEIRILPYYGNRVPNGWLPCNGQAVSIGTYQALFALLGTTYGGDGRTNFNVPDLRGRLCVGQGNLSTTASTHVLGAIGGTETVGLTADQGSVHGHAFNATTATDTSNAPGPTMLMGSDATYKHYATPPASPPYGALASQTIDSSGGNGQHPNIMPSIGLQFAICYDGFYPTQS